MKRLLILILCFAMLISSAFAETDLSNLTIDELKKLQNQIEEEIKTRNVGKMDFTPLENEELIQVIFRAISELCSRENFVEDSVKEADYIKPYFSGGIQLLFKSTKGTWYRFLIDSEDFTLEHLTAFEKTLENAASIKIGK